MPDGVGWTTPAGGLFTWLTFPEGTDTADLMKRVVVPNAKVAYVPGATFFAERQESNHARVNYSGVTEQQIGDGIARWAAALRG